MIFYTFIDLVCLPMMLLIVIVMLGGQIKNSSFFRSTPYTDEERAITNRYGRIIGKLYHWFI